MSMAHVVGVLRPAVSLPVVTWNPADKGANITLSGGNLIANGNTTHSLVRATLGVASPKRYFEVRLDGVTTTLDELCIGVVSGAHTLSSYVGFDAVGLGMWNRGYPITGGTGSGFAITGAVSGSTFGVAVDRSLNKIWFRLNGGGWLSVIGGSQDPTSGLGGLSISGVTGALLFPAVSLKIATNQATGRFRTADFAFAAPSGFTSWSGA